MPGVSQRTALPNTENIHRQTFDNGITVLIYENFAAQSVIITGALLAGSLNETADKNGLAALTASALMRGTIRRDFDAVHAALEDIGADLGYSAGVHRTRFYGKALAEDLPTLLDVLADTLQHPAFPEAQVELLRSEIMTGLHIREQDTRARAGRAFREALYPPLHPYYYSVRGTLDSVPNLHLEDLRAFHRQHYQPQGLLLVIVGAVQTQAALEQAQRALGDWRGTVQPDTPALPLLEKPRGVQRVEVTLAGKTQSDLVIGVAGPARDADDYFAAMLVNSVLGQFGMMGRIGAEVREKRGLAYYASSRIEGGYGPGAWSISAGVNPLNVQQAVEVIAQELRRISMEPVSAEDLADNQSYFVGRLPLQLESNEGIAGAILSMESFNLGLDYLLQYRDTVYRLTAQDLLAAAQHYWGADAGDYVLALAGPALEGMRNL